MRATVVCALLAVLAILPVVVVAVAQDQSPAPEEKKTIAIMPFDFGTVQKWWGEQTWDVGKGVSDLVVDRLLQSGSYRLVERTYLETLLAEQDFSESARADAATASQVGRVLGVDAIIVGSVTQFGTEEKKRGGFGGLIKVIPIVGALGGIGQQKGRAKVAITARAVNVSTGEIIASTTGTGESERSGLILGGLGVGGDTIAGGVFTMGSSDFRETILGEATYKAVESLAQQLDALADRIPLTERLVTGYIADVAGSTVVLNVGARHGCKVGDVLVVERVIRTVNDPLTGQLLRNITQPIGRVRVSEVDPESSVGIIIEGSGVKVGDIVSSE